MDIPATARALANGRVCADENEWCDEELLCSSCNAFAKDIESALRAAQAAALREAAEDGPQNKVLGVADWLRDRASRLAQGKP